MLLPCHGIYTLKYVRNEVWKCCHLCHTNIGFIYLFHRLFCGRSGYKLHHGNKKRPSTFPLKTAMIFNLLSRIEWWYYTHLNPTCLSISGSGDWVSSWWEKQSSPQTRSQMSLCLLNNQAIFKNKSWVNINNKLSFLLFTIKFTGPWLGIRNQTGVYSNSPSGGSWAH